MKTTKYEVLIVESSKDFKKFHISKINEIYKNFNEFSDLYSLVSGNFESFQDWYLSSTTILPPKINLDSTDKTISAYLSAYLDNNDKFSHTFRKFNYDQTINSFLMYITDVNIKKKMVSKDE